MTKILNIIGSVCSGKSTLASGLFYQFKSNGHSVELIHETIPKTSSYLQDKLTIGVQPYIFGDVLYRIELLNNKVDYIINECPLVLSYIYNTKYPFSFNEAVLDIAEMFDNIYLYTRPMHDYIDVGRLHSKEESADINASILFLLNRLDKFNEPLYNISGVSPQEIYTAFIELRLSEYAFSEWDFEL